MLVDTRELHLLLKRGGNVFVSSIEIRDVSAAREVRTWDSIGLTASIVVAWSNALAVIVLAVVAMVILQGHCWQVTFCVL